MSTDTTQPQQPATASPSPAQTPQEPPPAQKEMDLLRDFAKQPGCEAYSTDGKKIELLTTFIWLRQLTEGLSFELFLQKFVAVADYDDENRKHPLDALKHYCPRTKKAADTAGTAQWAAKECVDILALYAELLGFVDAGELTQGDIATIAQYLRMDAPAYKAGDITKPAASPTARKGRTAAAGAPAPADPDSGLVPTGKGILPTEQGQRVIYTMVGQGARQVKGTVVDVFDIDDKRYVTFDTDEGERMEGRNIHHFVVVAESPPPECEDILETKQLWIPKGTYPQVVQALALESPMANVKVADILYPFTVELATKTAEGNAMCIDINVVNGAEGPYVEAELVDLTTSVSVDQLNPRDNLLGKYDFVTPAGVIRVEVSQRT